MSRRNVLRGAGVALALPWLESVAPATARGQTPSPNPRYVALYFPNGTPAYWRPKGTGGTGDDWKLSPLLEPLAPVKNYLTVLTNISNYSPWGGHVEPSHSNLCASTWTCVAANGPNQERNGISVDQAIANHIGQASPLPSIQVGLATRESWTDEMAPQHSRSISWKSPSEPLYKLINPQAIFDRLTAGSRMGDPKLAERRRELRKSVLDYVRESTLAVQRKLSSSDQQRLEQYLASVRSLEQRVNDPGLKLTAAACRAERPPEAYAVGNVPESYSREAHTAVMIDLVVMALACNITRVVSFMLEDARSDFAFNFLTTRKFSETGSVAGKRPVGEYHWHQHEGEKDDGFATISWWNCQKAAQLATKLAETPDGSGANLLDNTVIMFCSGMRSGNHDARDLPVALLGGGGKTASGTVLKPNRHIVFEEEQRLADVHLTLMQRVFDMPDPSFGASSGPIPALTDV